MGYWKERQEDLFEAGIAGLTNGDRLVCPECMTDDALALFVRSNGTAGKCDFEADHEAGPCITIEALFRFMVSCLRHEWDNALNIVGWDEGWAGAKVIDSWDVLWELDDQPFEIDELVTAWGASVETEWCRRNPYALEPHERLVYGWERFTDFVKEHPTFPSVARPDPGPYPDPDEIAPHDLLEEVLQAVESVQHRVLVQVDTDRTILRGRAHGVAGVPISAAELGSPPPAQAIATRMARRGESMFYGADDQATVLAELRNPAHATVAAWKPTRDLTVLDLARLPPVPSIFAGDRSDRPWLIFLRKFATAIAAPIFGKPEVDYLPTQLLTAYLRDQLDGRGGPRLDGLRYQSAVCGDGVAWAIFAAYGQCVDEGCSDDTGMVMRLQPGTAVKIG